MGLLVHFSAHHADADQGAGLELVADLDLYHQYSRELNILHQVSCEPQAACLLELLQKIKAATEDSSQP